MATKAEIDWPRELERLACEAETEALAKADAIFAQADAEHQQQTDGYRFECRRWGDFLSVFIERAGNGVTWWGGEAERKVSTSLNLGRSKDIRLISGHCFDRLGRLTYRAIMVSDEQGGGSGWGSGAGMSAPWKGHHYEVRPTYPTIPKSREFVVVDPVPQGRESNMIMGNGDYQPQHVTEGYPRCAADDIIRFEGIGSTIHAPAGKGRMVYDAIMAEIARGYEPPAIAAGSREGHDSEAWRGAKQARAAIAQPSNPNEDGL